MLRFGASRSMRRSATVTISHPEASSAAFISSALRYLPVPSISRDVKTLSPMWSAPAMPALSRAAAWPPHSKSNIELTAFLDELLRLLLHPLLRVLAHVLRDLHRAEVRAAHRAEVGRLRSLGRQRGVVKLLRGLGVEGEVELVLPSELEARLRHGIVPGAGGGMALGQVGRVRGDLVGDHALLHVF